MKNWTDPIINWNQLPATEVRRLIATWGMPPEKIAAYDRKHGFTHTPAVARTPQVTAEPAVAPVAAQRARTVKVSAASLRQRHTGADGEVKFVEHRNLYVGFYGGRVVVTKRRAEDCRQVLADKFAVAA
jgi:hypothetical protein